MPRIHPLYAALAVFALAACQRQQAPEPAANASATPPAATAEHAFSPDINAADFS